MYSYLHLRKSMYLESAVLRYCRHCEVSEAYQNLKIWRFKEAATLIILRHCCKNQGTRRIFSVQYIFAWSILLSVQAAAHDFRTGLVDLSQPNTPTVWHGSHLKNPTESHRMPTWLFLLVSCLYINRCDFCPNPISFSPHPTIYQKCLKSWSAPASCSFLVNYI